MNEEIVREMNTVPQEELEKLDLLKAVLEKAKAISSLEKFKNEIAEQLKKFYAQKMAYDFLKTIVLKLHDDDITKLSKNDNDLVNILNTTTYNNKLREYLDLFAKIADMTTIDEGNGMISIRFYLFWGGYDLLLAIFNIYEDGSRESGILLSHMFDELQNLLEIPQQQLMSDIITFINNFKNEIEEDCDNDP